MMSGLVDAWIWMEEDGMTGINNESGVTCNVGGHGGFAQ